jgi:hypothetical protein
MFFRSIGGAVAVGGLGALLAASMGQHVPASLLNELLGPEHGRKLDPAIFAQLAGDLRGGLGHVFDAIALVSTGSLVVGALFPRRQLAAPDALSHSPPAPILGASPSREEPHA